MQTLFWTAAWLSVIFQRGVHGQQQHQQATSSPESKRPAAVSVVSGAAEIVSLGSPAAPVFKVNTVVTSFNATNPPVKVCAQGYLAAICAALGITPEDLEPLQALLGFNIESFLDSRPRSSRPRLIRKVRVNDSALKKQWLTLGNLQHVLSSAALRVAEGQTKSALRIVQKELEQEYRLKRGIPAETLEHPEKLDPALLPYINVFRKIAKKAPELIERKYWAAQEGENGGCGPNKSCMARQELTPSVHEGSIADVMPDILLAFFSSKLMSRLTSLLFGAVVPSGDLSFTIYSPMKNLGESLCDAANYSENHDFDPRWAVCTLMDLLIVSLGCKYADSPEPFDCSTYVPEMSVLPDVCTAADGTTFDPMDASTVVPLTLFQNYDPETITQDDRTRIEGVTEYFLYRAIVIASTYVGEQNACIGIPNPPQLVPGWDHLLTIQGVEELGMLNVPGPGSNIPLVTVSANREKAEEILITFRGTVTPLEWRLDFDYRKAPLRMPGLAGEDQVYVHGGFQRLVSSIVSPLQVFLDDYRSALMLKTGIDDLTLRIVLTGHSLGGGVTEVLALTLTSLYPKDKIEGIVFAPAVALDPRGYYLLKQRTNLRSIIFEFDAIPNMPCPNNLLPQGLPRCLDKESLMNPAEGYGYDAFGDHVDKVVLPFQTLVNIEPTYWGVTDYGKLKLDLQTSALDFSEMKIPIPLQLVANHTCSYACGSSHNCGLKWMCASDCFGWFGSPALEKSSQSTTTAT